MVIVTTIVIVIGIVIGVGIGIGKGIVSIIGPGRCRLSPSRSPEGTKGGLGFRV